MKTYINPAISQWETLSQRPTQPRENLDTKVNHILTQVKLNGDEALRKFTLDFDQFAVANIRVSAQEIAAVAKNISPELKTAIRIAARNIRKFHLAQRISENPVQTMDGVVCWRKNVAIDNVGLYIPGGTAPLFSTILMLAIPAQIAGSKRIVICTPVDSNGEIHPAILYTANFLGITEIYKVGGAQAIAALAFGTETIAKVNKIFGPGNQYVTKAKELVQQYGVAIDLPAGPSEVLVIADAFSDADFVASDLLSQAEHGADSQVVLLTDAASKITAIEIAIQQQLLDIPRAETAIKAFENSFAIVFDNLQECINFSNYYAPEHLIINTQNPDKLAESVVNAGSVFIGSYSCESAGDYASGTNHTLPTNGNAKSYSGVSVDSFVKKITFQKISQNGLKNIGSTIEIMAEAEGLIAHKNAVSIRLKKIENERL